MTGCYWPRPNQSLPPPPSPSFFPSPQTWNLCHHEAHVKVGPAGHPNQTDIGQIFRISAAACALLAAFKVIMILVTQARHHTEESTADHPSGRFE